MSTVYYLRYNICEHCDRYDYIHICKFSGGSGPYIYGYRNYRLENSKDSISVNSVDDMVELIKDDRFTLYDEYSRKIKLINFIDNYNYFYNNYGKETIGF